MLEELEHGRLVTLPNELLPISVSDSGSVIDVSEGQLLKTNKPIVFSDVGRVTAVRGLSTKTVLPMAVIEELNVTVLRAQAENTKLPSDTTEVGNVMDPNGEPRKTSSSIVCNDEERVTLAKPVNLKTPVLKAVRDVGIETKVNSLLPLKTELPSNMMLVGIDTDEIRQF